MEITTEFKNELQSAFIDATIVSNNINNLNLFVIITSKVEK